MGLKDMLFNTLLDSQLVKGFVNSKLSRYAEVKSIKYGAEGYEIIALPLGSHEAIIITIKDFEIDANDLGITLHGLSSNLIWIDHLLHDFLEGKTISVPEKYREIILKVKKGLGK